MITAPNALSFLRYRDGMDRNHETWRGTSPFPAKMIIPRIYIVFHDTYVRDATTIWLAGTRLHGNSPEIAVQFQSSPRNSLEIHSFSSARVSKRMKTFQLVPWTHFLCRWIVLAPMANSCARDTEWWWFTNRWLRVIVRETPLPALIAELTRCDEWISN